MEKILVLDGFSLLFRSFYATAKKDETGFKIKSIHYKGRPNNAIKVFITSLHNIIKNTKPEFLIIVFDSKVKSFRHNYDFYKAKRKEMPQELKVQIEPIKDILSIFGFPFIEMDGYEADDIIGVIANKFKPNYKIQIVSGDKDLWQLIDKSVYILYPNKHSNRPYQNIDVQQFQKEYEGLNPNQLVDLKAIIGDKSDNIPGIKGIDKKTAIRLLKKYQSLENIYKNISQIQNQNLKKKIANSKEIAFLSYKIVDFILDVDLSLTIDDLRIKKIDEEKLEKFVNYWKTHDLKKYINHSFLRKEKKSEPVENDLYFNDLENKIVDLVRQRAKEDEKNAKHLKVKDKKIINK